MSNRLTAALILSLLFAISALAIAGGHKGEVDSQNANSSTTMAPANRCDAVTDAEIVTAIHDKIRADKVLFAQRSHFNVSSLDRIVTLNGFVKGRSAVLRMGRLASGTRCVRRVKNKLGSAFRVGCGPGQKQCGDICIDENATCNPMDRQ